jgi:hypothetical protein
MKKVAYKEKSISEHPKRERRKLEKDSIKVVAGPGGQLFIADTITGPTHVLYKPCYPCLARVSWRRGAMIPVRRSKTTAAVEGDDRSEGLYA